MKTEKQYSESNAGLPYKTFFRSSTHEIIRTVVAQRVASEVHIAHQLNSGGGPGARPSENLRVFRAQYLQRGYLMPHFCDI